MKSPFMLRAFIGSRLLALLIVAFSPVGLLAQEAETGGTAPATVSATELQAAIDAIRRQVAEQKAERESAGGELAAELKAARDTLAELTESASRLRSEREALIADLEAERARVGELTADVAEAGRREVEAREALAQALEREKTAAAESETREAAAAARAREDAERLTAFDAELVATREKLSGVEEELKASRAALEEREAAHAARLAELEANLVAAGDAKRKLEARLDEEGEKLAAAAEAGKAVEERAAAAERSLAEAREATRALERELAALREVARNSVTEVKGLGEQLLASLKENDELGAALEQARASRSALEQELAAMRQDVQIYASELAAMREGRGGEGPVALVASDAVVETLDAELAAARERMRALNEELIARDKQLVALGEAGDPDALAQQLGVLERELAAAKAENSRMADELAALHGGGDAATPELLVASLDTDGAAGSVLGQLNAVDTGDGWWMTVPEGLDFAPGSGELAPGSGQALAQVVALLGYFDEAPVRIVGHTDSYGDAEVNRRLSLLRADAVRDVLVSEYGVDPARVETEGLGEDRPVSSNATIEGRRANRRVEIYVRRRPLDG